MNTLEKAQRITKLAEATDQLEEFVTIAVERQNFHWRRVSAEEGWALARLTPEDTAAINRYIVNKAKARAKANRQELETLGVK